MYEAELASTWQYIINDSGIVALFVSRQEILDKVNARDKVPGLKKTILIEGEGTGSMAALEASGRKNPVPSIKPASPDEIAVLIYTSGTTGEPKGVLLSHGNLASNVVDAHSCFPEFSSADRSLAILPWAHSYGLTADLNHFTYLGGSIALVGSIETIAEDLKKAQPTALIAVPRIFNRVYEAIWAKVEEEGGLPRKLFIMGVETAKKKRELAAQDRKSFGVDLEFKLVDAGGFKKVRAQLGATGGGHHRKRHDESRDRPVLLRYRHSHLRLLRAHRDVAGGYHEPPREVQDQHGGCRDTQLQDSDRHISGGNG